MADTIYPEHEITGTSFDAELEKLPNAVPGHTYDIELQTVFGGSIAGDLQGPRRRDQQPAGGRLAAP